MSHVDSHSEALSLANDAIDYIHAHGITDGIFKTYFGTVEDSTKILDIFTVCPDYPDSSTILIAPQFQAAVNEEPLALHCTHSNSICTVDSAIANLGAYNDGTNV